MNKQSNYICFKRKPRATVAFATAFTLVTLTGAMGHGGETGIARLVSKVRTGDPHAALKLLAKGNVLHAASAIRTVRNSKYFKELNFNEKRPINDAIGEAERKISAAAQTLRRVVSDPHASPKKRASAAWALLEVGTVKDAVAIANMPQEVFGNRDSHPMKNSLGIEAPVTVKERASAIVDDNRITLSGEKNQNREYQWHSSPALKLSSKDVTKLGSLLDRNGDFIRTDITGDYYGSISGGLHLNRQRSGKLGAYTKNATTSLLNRIEHHIKQGDVKNNVALRAAVSELVTANATTVDKQFTQVIKEIANENALEINKMPDVDQFARIVYNAARNATLGSDLNRELFNLSREHGGPLEPGFSSKKRYKNHFDEFVQTAQEIVATIPNTYGTRHRLREHIDVHTAQAVHDFTKILRLVGEDREIGQKLIGDFFSKFEAHDRKSTPQVAEHMREVADVLTIMEGKARKLAYDTSIQNSAAAYKLGVTPGLLQAFDVAAEVRDSAANRIGFVTAFSDHLTKRFSELIKKAESSPDLAQKLETVAAKLKDYANANFDGRFYYLSSERFHEITGQLDYLFAQ